MDLYWIDPSLAIASRPRGGDWLDDEMLEGRLDLMGILPLMTQAIEAFVEAGNREERRAVKKVGKKAVRKSA